MGAAEPRIAALLLACVCVCAADAGKGFNLSEPEPGVFEHAGRQLPLDVPGHDDIANIGFIVGEKCVAVIDTGGSMSIGRELRAAIAKHTSPPICYVINTHVPGMHVIGDACIADPCIADPMPKAASAAASQGKQCALAIAAALDGREPPAPQFDSVCYSMLGRGRALSIHARFQLQGGAIQKIAAPEDAAPPSAEQDAQNAEAWYRRIVADSFGA